jgi:hypothetical protein
MEKRFHKKSINSWLAKVFRSGKTRLVQLEWKEGRIIFPYLIQGALRLSAHVLSHDKDQLYSQLYGRLSGFERLRGDGEYAEIKQLLQGMEDWKAGNNSKPWLRLLSPTLTISEDSMIRMLEGHTSKVMSIVITPDGKRIVSHQTIILLEYGT